MSDRNDLGAFLDEAWGHLTRGVADRHAPARHPAFATVSSDGLPEVRTVVLRAARKDARVLEVHTDRATAKMRALAHKPVAALHVWVPRARLQIRVQARVEIMTGESVEAYWAKIPQQGRVSYGTEPPPGESVADADAYETPAARDRFAVLCCHLLRVDLLHLGERHRRAVFQRDDGWQGQWVAP